MLKVLDKNVLFSTVFAGGLLLMALCTPSFAGEPSSKAPDPSQGFSKEQLAQLQNDGEKLAVERCASCHSIKSEGDSIMKEAPPFRTFANKWPLEALEESLAEGIVTGHEEMPESIFTPEEITAFLEFLRTLQKK